MIVATTHQVLNQAPPLGDYDTSADPVLLDSLVRGGAEWAVDEVSAVGRLAGSEHMRKLGQLAQAHPPQLHTHDRYGNRIDEVEYDPAYHQLMTTAVEHGIAAAPWAENRRGVHLARAAKLLVWTPEPGHTCPISMSYAVVPALRMSPGIASSLEPRLSSRVYDPELRDPATKPGLIAGMSMTEKQGGSDVRTNTTRAEPLADGSFALTGHKWFTSAPMSDFFLTLAQAPRGLSCFLVPRVLPGGERNQIRLMRLKDKLGNKANASSEIEYEHAIGWLIGEQGRGVRTIVEMVNLTRLDCVLGSTGGMRTALKLAGHHVRHRHTFGKALIDQPLMRQVIADLAVEAEASTLAAMRLAEAHDRAVNGDPTEAALRRLALAASKYYICKRGPIHAAEALECLGGNGYIEDSGMPQIYREQPLLSIWEGSGNVAALDALRALARDPEPLEVYFTEMEAATGADPRFDDALQRLKKEFADPADLEVRARRVVEQLALVFQGSLLLQYSSPAVADAFCATRLDRDWGGAFGTMPARTDFGAIVDRAVAA
ncbi:putative acyl-CoA dehydrogenase [Naumannella halotolerans]|uniref:Putative acyl-CoA dehydrogenase n=1 Tax=Naumannella halotolerans TaxID=993414 RepID=A0A4V3ENA3_9ACTN|nr:putative acyl-CoA dehydrogenase [Naumannella halotolerans]